MFTAINNHNQPVWQRQRYLHWMIQKNRRHFLGLHLD